jgi:enterochelin esterase-like enzyme
VFDGLLGFRLDQPMLLVWAAVVAALLAVILITGRRSFRSVITKVLAAVCGAVFAYVLAWVLGDVLDVFGIGLTPTTRAWAAVACAGAALAIVSIPRARAWRVVTAVVAVPVFLLIGALGINQDFGQFPTVRSALGISPYGAFTSVAAAHGTTADWRAPTDLPADGRVERVDIPATTSGFRHREALVYLPPAALTAHPPALPVIEAFSGQPGQPADLFASAGFAGLLDRFAASHHGLAPIVVVPDQLGAPDANPMCVDGPLGNSASYLTVDVPAWITAHLPVSSARTDWFIAGFSQGGTCSIQLGAAHPERFGGILDISGEVVPTIGPSTVAKGFGGSEAAYAAAAPSAIMAERAPYADTVAIFGYGSADARYGPGVERIQAAAAAAGMRTSTFVSQGTAHDWHTVHTVLEWALPAVASRFGLG